MFKARLVTAVALLVLSSAAMAAQRVQAGQWESTMTVGSGKPVAAKYCITVAEAESMSGDEATLRRYLETSTEKATSGRCSVKAVKLEGDQTVVTLVCGKNEVTNTTTYHGDRYESTSSNGAKVAGKRVGACP